MASNLVGACSDGALIMLKKHSGMLTRLKQKYPKIILWHCMCHRVELAIGDAVQSVTQINHVKSYFLDLFYSIFSQSPKAQHELEECAIEKIKLLSRSLTYSMYSYDYSTFSQWYLSRSQNECKFLSQFHLLHELMMRGMDKVKVAE